MTQGFSIYDERGMARVVHSYHVPSGGNYSHRTYARDERDRIIAWQKAEDGRGDRYGYDAEGQLTSAWYQAQNPFGTPTDARRSDSFAYDALGNRYGTNTVASRGAVNFSRRDNGLNQYASWSPSVINYEGNGVLIQEGMISSDFNALNQPTWMWANGMNGVMRFGYDPLGRCVKRWFGADDPAVNAATYLYYDGWNLIQEGGGPWAPSRLYAHGNRVDEVAVSFRNATAEHGGEHGFHQYDARGHTILLTNGNAGLMEQYDYDAFGKPYFYSAGGTQLPDSPFGNRILFTGREWLKELGVYDFRHRHYQPELGRFLQPDPIQFKAGDYNLYRYCHNDPVNKSDPEGLLQLSSAFKKAYPKAAQRIESLDRRVNKRQLDAFKKFGQATPQTVDKALDPNSGPKLVDAKLNAFGEFTPNQKSSEIRISDKLLKDFEAGLASSRLLEATVLHETTHYLDDQDGVDYPGEEGELFEIAVYGSVQFK